MNNRPPAYLKDDYYTVDDVKLYQSHFNLDIVRYFFPNRRKLIYLDIGSFDAGDSIRFKMKFPCSVVYSIEADPNRFEFIKSLEKHGINARNYAVCNKTEVVDFYQSYDPNANEIKSGPAGSMLKATNWAKETYNHLTYLEEPIKVQGIRLDDFCKKENIKTIDVIHMDVEGVGKEIIQGFGDIKPKLINMEIEAVLQNYEGSSTVEEIESLLFPLGYEFIETNHGDSLYKLK